MSRVILLGDFHSGHCVGLTPPSYQYQRDHENKHLDRFGRVQREMWDWYAAKADALGPVDVLLVNGDALDGHGAKTKGSELVQPDVAVQAEMAAACIAPWKAKTVLLTYGTGYHTGDGVDYEQLVAHRVGGFIDDEHFFEVNGVTFHAKHHIGRSSVPHGRHTAIAKENLWNRILAAESMEHRAQFTVRSHVHYHAFAGGPGWLGMTLPALQAAGSKFGRRCTGAVDVGLVCVDVNEHGEYAWKAHILRLQQDRRQLLTL